MQDNDIEIHDNVECCVVHPNGQFQSIQECWCKLYHIFGKNIESNDVEITTFDHFGSAYQCMYLSEKTIKSKFNGQQLPLNINLQRRLMKNIYGPGVFFQKGNPISAEQAKKILMFQR